ncbi:hypothetical protein ASPZODRAFT_151547 [Penicilliopsis zonata CBS 506.65]|uniref:DUF7730 domain-containing protein n=1 Tax=Penicilliopsis zonata CBS 506.65 TaxID=1073090 RepID=A0A1L9SIA0_9EURO|nr:hypothetical protein ASPZODRAFT_151547 [Penicilliopsis zonata CBS 506.65]OJJ46945.1 hypothetical protein ASPZODRAFT_151547 [Penicilliopsis zonata CBS 506.65]
MARLKQGVFSWEDVLTQRYQSNKPNALRPRRRTLTGHQQEQQEQQEQPDSSTQEECRLLARLSPELRLIIWEYVLGGRRLHIVQRPHRRLGYIICSEDGSCDVCLGVVKKASHGDQLLSLPMTCRQIYTECIHMIYALNRFEFNNTWSLTYLRPTIPAERWESIRAVELSWAFPGHWLPSKDPVKSVYFSAGRAQWVETCQALTRMKGLQAFTLSLSVNWFCEPVEKIPVFLEPLRDLNLKKGWAVHLPEQPYYLHEMASIGSVLRSRGIDCVLL